jgi:hypothetical protein
MDFMPLSSEWCVCVAALEDKQKFPSDHQAQLPQQPTTKHALSTARLSTARQTTRVQQQPTTKHALSTARLSTARQTTQQAAKRGNLLVIADAAGWIIPNSSSEGNLLSQEPHDHRRR